VSPAGTGDQPNSHHPPTMTPDRPEPGTIGAPSAATDAGRLGRPGSRGASGPAVLLVLGYLGHVGLRLALSAGRYGPLVFADETGYLLDARFLTGGPAGQMMNSTFYRGGYAAVISPAYLLAKSPVMSYNLVLGINALLSSSTFLLMYWLLAKPFRLARGPALAASFLAALYPPLVLNSQLAVSENLLVPLVLLAFVLLARWVSATEGRGRWGWPIALGLCAGLLYASHGRTIVVVGVLLAATAAVGLVRRDLRVPAVAAIGVAATSLAAGEVFNAWLARNNWGTQPTEAATVLSKAAHLSALKGIAELGVGQYWYLAVSTFGLFGLGVAQAVEAMRAPGADRPGRGRTWLASRLAGETDGRQLVAAGLLGALLALAALVGISGYPPLRPDHVVYGRYIEILLPIFFALGLNRLWCARPTRRVLLELAVAALLTGAAYLVVRGLHGGLVHGTIANAYTTLSLPGPAGSITALHIRRVTTVAIGGALLLALFSRKLRVVGGVALAAALLASILYTRSTLFQATQDAVYGKDGGAKVTVPGLDRSQDIAYDVGNLTIGGRWGFQWQLEKTHFVLFDSRLGQAPPRVRYVISSQTWSQANRLGAVTVWRATHGAQAVWMIPSVPPAPLTTAARNPTN
jgi:4-amino-4-deoxy-L-arabinose transferase-like glycosyltransferase